MKVRTQANNWSVPIQPKVFGALTLCALLSACGGGGGSSSGGFIGGD